MIWTAGIIRSGERKSAAQKEVMRPIHVRQVEIAEQHRQREAEYEVELQAWKGSPKGDPDDKPTEPPPMEHLYLNDTHRDYSARWPLM